MFSNCHAKKKEAGKPPHFTLLDKLLYLTGRALSPTIGGEGDVGKVEFLFLLYYLKYT